MSTGITIRKFLFIALWVAIGGVMFTLLMAAITKKNKGTCRDYVVTVRGDESNLFMNREEISALLEELCRGPVKGQPVASFDLQKLEKELEKDTWIDQAELYFDSKDVLHLTVSEKIPVARVFMTTGKSFYTDSTGSMIPLSEKRSARLPVFTGFPGKTTLSEKDSVLLQHVAATANYILKDPFWAAQVSQVDILPDRTFELIPLVGDHRVKLGDGKDIAAKFHRLSVFYKQVLAKTGLNAYRHIDVQYQGQVVASRFGSSGKVDSIQLRKNVEKLLRQSKDARPDTVAKIRPKPVVTLKEDEEPVAKPELPLENNTDPNPVKTTSVSPGANEAPAEKTPKAVMPKRAKPEDNKEEQ